MKIFTEVFQKNAKLLNGLVEKGNQLFESIYFDFNSSYAYVLTSKTNTRISFLWEKEDNDTYSNFLISLESFITICNLHDEFKVSFNDTAVSFTNERETYEISYFKDDVDLSNFNSIDDNNLVNLEKSIRAKYLANLIKYADNVDTSNLNGLFIKNNRLLATDTTKFYEVDLSLISSIAYPDINLPLYLAKIICLNSESELYYNIYDKFIHLKIDSDIDILTSNSKKIELPVDPSSQEFISAYDHTASFVFKKDSLSDYNSVLDFFLKDVPNQRVYCSITETELELNVLDYNKVKKFVKIYNVDSILIGHKFWISFNSFKNAINSFSSKYLKIQIQPNSPTVNITPLDFEDTKKNDENHHILIVKLKD